MPDDQIGLRLVAEARRRRAAAAYVRQTIVIGTNLGYSLVVASVLDLVFTPKPRFAVDAYIGVIALSLLAMTLILALQGEA